MRRALVIIGDSEIGNAIAEGVESNEQAIAERESFFHEDVKKSVRYATGCRNWKALYLDMIERYGFPSEYVQPNIVSQKILLAWALIWSEIFGFYHRMAERNRN